MQKGQQQRASEHLSAGPAYKSSRTLPAVLGSRSREAKQSS